MTIGASGSVLFSFLFSTRQSVSTDDQTVDMVYQLGARWYDPGVGRFISPDPAGFVDGPNLYAYVSNNPVNFIDPLGLAGIPLKLTDVSKIAKLADAFQYQIGGVRFRSLLRRNGESYLALSGARAAHFPLAPGGYRLDNPQVAAYLQPGAAARGYLKSSGALGTALIVTQDVANQLMSGGSLTDQRFLGHTAIHVANGFVAGAIGAGVGALSTSLTLNPAVGIVAGVGTSVGVNQGLENIEHWVVHQISTN